MRQRLTTSIFCWRVWSFFLRCYSPATRGGIWRSWTGAAPAPATNQPFDPKDLSGIWWRTGGTREWNTQKGEEPVFTAEGKKASMPTSPDTARERFLQRREMIRWAIAIRTDCLEISCSTGRSNSSSCRID